MQKRLRLVILFIHFMFFLAAQPGGQYLFSHLGTKDGLIANHVYGVQQDSRGYIWIGSSAGIQRYDGQRFVTFRNRSNVPGSIPEGTVYGLYLDNKDRLWGLFGGFKIGYINTRDLTYHEVPLKVPNDILLRSKGGMYIDNGGNIMAVVLGYGVLTYKEYENAFTLNQQLFSLPDKWLPNFIWQDNKNNYWIGCDSGLVKYNTASRSMAYRDKNAEKDPVIRRFGELKEVIYSYIDSKNRFWLTSWPLTGLKVKSLDISSGIEKDWEDILGRSIQGRYYELQGISEIHDGTVWFAGHNLFAKLNKNATGVEPILANLPGEFSIRFDDIHKLFEDREKNIWVATDKGLFRFNPTAQLFKSISLQRFGKDSIYTPDVTDILQTRDGLIHISTWGNGIFSYDRDFIPHSSVLSRHSLNASEGMAWAMHERSNGDVWRVDQAGIIFIFRTNSGKVERMQPPVFEKSTIRQITEDRQGNIWLSTQRGYLVKWDVKTEEFSVVHKLGSITTRLITDPDGKLWVATEVNGLYHIDPSTGKIIAQYSISGSKGKLRANHVMDVVPYTDSIVMIAANGLNILNRYTGVVRYLTEEDGLISNAIQCMAKDKDGYLWMATSGGISSYHPSKSKLSTYNSSDGVHSTSFSAGSASILLDGRIAFGTAHDILLFDPPKVTVNEYYPPTIEISGISVMNHSLPVDSLMKLQEIDLAYNQNSITFDLSSLTYQNLYPIYYILEGVDDDWRQVTKTNQAVYTYLPPGNYTFKTSSMNVDGERSKVTSIRVSISSPFWKTWWFYSLLVLAVSAVLFAFDRQRMQRLKREQQIRSAIAGNLHMDVSTGLKNINVLSEIAGMKAEKQPEQSKEFIAQIQQKSRSMVIAMNDVLWSVDPKNDGMPKTIERLHEVAHAMQNRHAIQVEVQTDDKVSGLKLDMNIRHELIIIYKLVLISLVEELKAPQTIVELDYVKPLLNLKILSVGVSLPRYAGPVSRNMSEIRQRAASIGAELLIQSDEKSTEIILGLRV